MESGFFESREIIDIKKLQTLLTELDELIKSTLLEIQVDAPNSQVADQLSERQILLNAYLDNFNLYYFKFIDRMETLKKISSENTERIDSEIEEASSLYKQINENFALGLHIQSKLLTVDPKLFKLSDQTNN